MTAIVVSGSVFCPRTIEEDGQELHNLRYTISQAFVKRREEWLPSWSRVILSGTDDPEATRFDRCLIQTLFKLVPEKEPTLPRLAVVLVTFLNEGAITVQPFGILSIGEYVSMMTEPLRKAKGKRWGFLDRKLVSRESREQLLLQIVTKPKELLLEWARAEGTRKDEEEILSAFAPFQRL